MPGRSPSWATRPTVVVPVTKILPALVQAFQGDRAGAQVAINQLLLTTGPVSLLYWGFDEARDRLTTGPPHRCRM